MLNRICLAVPESLTLNALIKSFWYVFYVSSNWLNLEFEDNDSYKRKILEMKYLDNLFTLLK